MHVFKSPEIEHPPLDRPIATKPDTFAKRIVHVLLTVLATNVTLQKHGVIEPKIIDPEKRLGRYTRLFGASCYVTPSKSEDKKLQNIETRKKLRKMGVPPGRCGRRRQLGSAVR